MPRKKGRWKPKKSTSRRYSVEERAQIIGQADMGASDPDLIKRWGIDKHTLSDLKKKFDQTRSVKDLPRSGRPRKTSEREDRHLAITVARDPRMTATVMAKKLVPGYCKNRISRWTVARRLREWDFGAHVAAKKPLLSYDHMQKRLEWAKKHVEWDVEDWKRVLFSDETPFCLFQSFGRKIVWT
jgi:transposase